MRLRMFTAASLLAMTLMACGSDVQEPVEQIVVREPGETSAAPAGANLDLVAAGEAAFAVCAACHSVTPGDGSGIGPNLHGVVGRPAGALTGFSYSDALASSGLTWSADQLDAFIANPQAKVPGTSMSAGAVSDGERRAAIIAYLASLSS